MRLGTAFVALTSLYASWYGGIGMMPFVPLWLWYGILGLAVSLFVVLVILHTFHYSRLNNAELMHRVMERELAALRGDFSFFKHGGEFLTERDSMTLHAEDFAQDLDIFGEFSLFQRCNRTVTPLGYKSLAEYLTTTLVSHNILRARQEALQELSAATGFRHKWLATEPKRQLTGLEQRGLEEWMRESIAPKKSDISQQTWFRALLWALPFLTNGVGMVSVYFSTPDVMRLLGLCVFVQLIFWAMFLQRTRREVAMMQRAQYLLAVYVQLFSLTKNEMQFRSPILQRCASEASAAMKSIKKLRRILEAYQNGQSMFGAIVFNGFFLLDVHCMVQLADWRKNHAGSTESWFDMLGEMDALVSMAGYVFTHPEYTMPTILPEGSPMLVAKGVYHPFLSPEEAVKNSLVLSAEKNVIASSPTEGQIAVITGANMAGKSTFLRALALNTVLAHIGLPVAADEFSCSLMQVVTSMRVADSLERHESYFYAELQRLAMIVERLRRGTPMLVVMDEILRGTNSADKKAGTIGLLRQFLEYSSLAIIATHDTEIGNLEQEFPLIVRNFCFEGVIAGNELYFDYTLRSSVAQNKNATFLMHKMGILRNEQDSLVD